MTLYAQVQVHQLKLQRVKVLEMITLINSMHRGDWVCDIKLTEIRSDGVERPLLAKTSRISNVAYPRSQTFIDLGARAEVYITLQQYEYPHFVVETVEEIEALINAVDSP